MTSRFSAPSTGSKSLQSSVKRGMDLSLSAVLLVAFSPIMAVAWLAIRLTMGKPILFRQVRPGYLGRPFVLLKFRSMDSAAGPDGQVIPTDERITSVGRVLRRTSADELPQLWNILKGDMSFVGPRPLRMDYLSLYTPEQARRHEVRPGLTGLAQVNGRYVLPWEERFRLDVWYVDHQSLGLDIRILLSSIPPVIMGRDLPVTAEDYEDFTGTGMTTDDSDARVGRSAADAMRTHKDQDQ